ncbi:hypothetical protein [Sorangium sp. So ce1153]|uniref:hypothetical protein n=1 Tax=Sorangium sp. So ce1153 TaxID=3133333 RepID=UPI003F62C350
MRCARENFGIGEGCFVGQLAPEHDDAFSDERSEYRHLNCHRVALFAGVTAIAQLKLRGQERRDEVVFESTCNELRGADRG